MMRTKSIPCVVSQSLGDEKLLTQRSYLVYWFIVKLYSVLFYEILLRRVTRTGEKPLHSCEGWMLNNVVSWGRTLGFVNIKWSAWSWDWGRDSLTRERLRKFNGVARTNLQMEFRWFSMFLNIDPRKILKDIILLARAIAGQRVREV